METIWRENPNGPINWDLGSKEEIFTNEKFTSRRVVYFGFVDKDYKDKYRATVPIPYWKDEETGEESDCQDLGLFDTLDEAKKAVEESYCLDYWV